MTSSQQPTAIYHTCAQGPDFSWPRPVVLDPALAEAFEGMTPEQIAQMAEVAEVVKKLHPNGGNPQDAPDGMIEAVDAARKAGA